MGAPYGLDHTQARRLPPWEATQGQRSRDSRHDELLQQLFETTRHSGPDVSGTICLQQIAGLDRTNAILSEMSAPIQRSIMYPEKPSEGDVPSEELPFFPPVFDVTSDDYSVSDGDSQVSENTEPSHQSQVSLRAEGVTPVEPTDTAGTSQCGRVHTMSQRMAESINQGMHHVAHLSTMGKLMKTSSTTPTLIHKSV